MKLHLRPSCVSAILLTVGLLSGCAYQFSAKLRCAPVVLVNGEQKALNAADYMSVEPKLAAYLEDRGMVLVSDVSTADMLATVAYEPDASDPRKVNVLVLEIEENHLNPRRAMPTTLPPFESPPRVLGDRQ